MKETVIDALQDDHLQQEMIKTLTKASGSFQKAETKVYDIYIYM